MWPRRLTVYKGDDVGGELLTHSLLWRGEEIIEVLKQQGNVGDVRRHTLPHAFPRVGLVEVIEVCRPGKAGPQCGERHRWHVEGDVVTEMEDGEEGGLVVRGHIDLVRAYDLMSGVAHVMQRSVE